jgi:hypothetical protein
MERKNTGFFYNQTREKDGSFWGAWFFFSFLVSVCGLMGIYDL